MTSTPLVFEFAITGFIYLAGVLFLFMRAFLIKDFSFIPQVKDYFIPISIIAVGFAYMLGILFHRISLILIPKFLSGVKFWQKKSTGKNKSGMHEYSQSDNLIFVWQYGSDRLFESLDYHNKITSYFRSLTTAFPFFGISFSLWLYITPYYYLTWIALTISLFMGLLSYVVYRDQRKRLTEVNEAAINEMLLMRNKVLQSDSRQNKKNKSVSPTKTG